MVQLHVFFEDIAGTFETVIQSVEHRTCALAVADWNGDMVFDLATGDLETDTISIRLGNRDGTLQPGVDLPTDQEPESLTTTDFNQNTFPDIAVATGDGGEVSIWLGVGNGTFQLAGSYASGFGGRTIIHGDFNVDGKPDLAV